MLRLHNLKIKWKLVLWSSTLIMGLFLGYNLLQYVVISTWMTQHEKGAIQVKMDKLQQYYQTENHAQSYSDLLKSSKEFLQSTKEESETITVFDQNKKPIVGSSSTVDGWKTQKSISHSGVMTEHFGDDQLLLIEEPISTHHFHGSIKIVRNLKPFDSLLDQFGIVMLMTLLGAIVVSIGGALFLSSKLLKPLQEISMTLTRVKTYGLTERVLVSENRDEISELAIHFNQLMDELEESFNKQKQFVEDASHELRTPLAALKGNLSMLNRWGKDDREVLEKSLSSSLKEVDRLIHLTKNLLELTRLETNEDTTNISPLTDPKAVIKRVVEKIQILHPDFNLKTQGLHDDLLIHIDEDHLEQLLVIFIDNAIKYSRQLKEVMISLSKEMDTIKISVQDWGIGIPSEEIPLVINRFYRVDKSRNSKKGGHGLGLSIAKRIVEKYNGDLTIKSKINVGTIVELTFKL